MPTTKIILDRKGIDALLKSDEIRDYIAAQASGIQSRAGDGYETDTHMMPTRVIASVYTADRKAYSENLENNTLLKAVSE